MDLKYLNDDILFKNIFRFLTYDELKKIDTILKIDWKSIMIDKCILYTNMIIIPSINYRLTLDSNIEINWENIVKKYFELMILKEENKIDIIKKTKNGIYFYIAF